MKKLLVFVCAALVVFSCATGGRAAGVGSGEGNDISALGAIGGLGAAATGPLYEGDGGKDIRLAVLAPEPSGGAPDYLPLYIQGFLNNNIGRYSAITLIDRQNLNKIIAEQDMAATDRFSEKDFVRIGNLANAQYILAGTIQKLAGERYSLQLSVTDASSGVRRATFMKDGIRSQIERSGTLINEAAADILDQLGVKLTAAGRLKLLAGNTAAVRAETGLAKGITAQAGGAEIEALFNYTQSIAFDPGQMEALARLSTLSSSISGGTISQRIVNDLQARDRWLEAFKETAKFLNEHPPFEITFDPNLTQEGKTDYKKRSANLGMRIALDPSEAGFTALNALLEGLESTGRRGPWGFVGWPLRDIQPKISGTVLFGGKPTASFKVDVTLLNEQGKRVGKSTVTLTSGVIRFSAGDTQITPPEGASNIVRFDNVRADYLTPTLTIVISAVNGIASRTLNASGYMRIAAGEIDERRLELQRQNFVWVEGGTFQMGSRKDGHNQIPVHSVTVSGFSMAKYEVTQKEWQEIMETNPSRFKGDNLPVGNVSWYDAVEYCNKLSEKEGLTPAYTIHKDIKDPNNKNDDEGSYADELKWQVSWNRNSNGYRLPTEAEWEYAAKGGKGSPGNYTYSGSNDINAVAWYESNSRDTTHPVGTKKANGLGIYDMNGNVVEWCWDWKGGYPSEAQTDPVGASSGSIRVYRGGAYYTTVISLTFRSDQRPSFHSYYTGFRLVRP